MADKKIKGIKLKSFANYKNPPINEVSCGIRFQTPDKLHIPHIGLLWDKYFKSEYPVIQHALPITTVRGEVPIDTITRLPLPRVWFINKSNDQLVQFQFDRFYYNWRRMNNIYPHYPFVIEKFKSVYNNIIDFFDENEIGKLIPIEYELTYTNYVPKGDGWDSLDDLPKIFSDFVWRQTKKRFLPNPINLNWHAEFPLPDKKGNLIINLKHAILANDKLPVLVFDLTVRGISEEDIIKWFDLAHEWIIQGFIDLTAPEIRRYWESEKNV